MIKLAVIAALVLVPAVGLAAQSAAEVKGARGVRLFRQADTDGNGVLSRAEFGRAMPHLANAFSRIDVNRDGQIARAELAAWNKAQRSGRRANAAERFRHADADGDGAISHAEAGKHAPRLARRFDAIDADRDGRLTQEELRAYREAKRGRSDQPAEQGQRERQQNGGGEGQVIVAAVVAQRDVAGQASQTVFAQPRGKRGQYDQRHDHGQNPLQHGIIVDSPP